MIKLITPAELLLTTALLAIFCGCALLIASIERSMPLAAGGVTCGIACVGVALMKPWSRYLVYLVTAGFASKWLYSIFDAANAGFFDVWLTSWQEIARALAPGSFLLILSVLCSYLVARRFRIMRNDGLRNLPQQ